MNRPKKPTYKLEVGKKPFTSFRGDYGCGVAAVYVSDNAPDAAKLLASLLDQTWGGTCRKMLHFWHNKPPEVGAVQLTEPGEWSLAAEVERMDNVRAAKAAKSGEGAEK